MTAFVEHRLNFFLIRCYVERMNVKMNGINAITRMLFKKKAHCMHTDAAMCVNESLIDYRKSYYCAKYEYAPEK